MSKKGGTPPSPARAKTGGPPVPEQGDSRRNGHSGAMGGDGKAYASRWRSRRGDVKTPATPAKVINKNERIRCPFVFGVFRNSVENTIIRRCFSGVRLSVHVCMLRLCSSSRTHHRTCILHMSWLRMFCLGLFLFWFSTAEFRLINRDGEVNRSIVHPCGKVSDDANTLTFNQIRKQFLAKTANTIEP